MINLSVCKPVDYDKLIGLHLAKVYLAMMQTDQL